MFLTFPETDFILQSAKKYDTMSSVDVTKYKAVLLLPHETSSSSSMSFLLLLKMC